MDMATAAPILIAVGLLAFMAIGLGYCVNVVPRRFVVGPMFLAAVAMAGGMALGDAYGFAPAPQTVAGKAQASKQRDRDDGMLLGIAVGLGLAK